MSGISARCVKGTRLARSGSPRGVSIGARYGRSSERGAMLLVELGAVWKWSDGSREQHIFHKSTHQKLGTLMYRIGPFCTIINLSYGNLFVHRVVSLLHTDHPDPLMYHVECILNEVGLRTCDWGAWNGIPCQYCGHPQQSGDLVCIRCSAPTPQWWPKLDNMIRNWRQGMEGG